MSAPPIMPPPYGSAPGSPAGFDKRAFKNAQRAAAAQAKAFRSQQRAQIRAQMRAARRRSVVGPLLLVALGVVLLSLQTGRLHWADALDWLGRWWPAILILAGGVMVGEWAIDRRQLPAEPGVMMPRRHLGGGAVSLLILLGAVGATVMATHNSSTWIRQNFDEDLQQSGLGDWRKAFGFRSEFTAELDAPLSSTGTLTVDAPRGDVTITGSSADGEVHVTAHQHVFAWQNGDEEQRRHAEEPRFSGDPGHLTLRAVTSDEDDADLTIEMPHNAAVIVHSNHGDVTLEEVRGAVDLTAGGGDVKLTALRGPVHVQTQDDDATITAHSLGSGLTLEGRTGDIDLSDIDGAVALHGDFFGTTHLQRIRGNVHFQSSFTDFACAGVPGDLNVEGRSDLDGNHLLGPVTIATTNRNLTLHEIQGAITISDRNGSVEVAQIGSPEAVHIHNENGSVEVSEPAGSSFSLQAETQNGKVENDFGLLPRSTGESAQLIGQVGRGGPVVSIQTNEGDITVQKNSGEKTADWGDKAPTTASTRNAENPDGPA